MFPRYLAGICLLVFVAIAYAEVAEDAASPDGEELVIAEPRNPALAFAIRLIARELGKRVGKCLAEAAENCRSDWKHAHALVKCAKEFAEKNKGRCLA